uniref:Uncharacterized protein n=3 Tax=Rhizophagus irregularis TaxID=588596 RepID=U9STL2_RHIID
MLLELELLRQQISQGTREENTELKSRVAGNDQGSLALDEQSQNVKEVIAETEETRKKQRDQEALVILDLTRSGDIESVSNKAPFDCAPSEQHQKDFGIFKTKRRNRLMSSKVLQMSKLRAEITYGHHLHNNPTSIEPTNDDPAANLETNSGPIGDDSDDEITEPRLENDFGEYLQGPTGDVTHPANDEVNLPF